MPDRSTPEELAVEAAMRMADAADCDPTRLAGLRTLGGNMLVRELVSLFLHHSAEKLDAAGAALEIGDLKAVAFATHTLKSSCGQLGVGPVQTWCQDAERAANAGDAAAARAAVDAARVALDRARPWLAAELAA